MSEQFDKAYFDAKWAEVPQDVKDRAVKHLRNVCSESFFEQARELYAKDPEGWMLPYHFQSGMGIRNELRNAVPDSELPDGNWDDYYVQALEVAVGVRE